MASTTIRINKSTLETLKEIAGRVGEPLQIVLSKAIESYRRQRFLEETNSAYAKLRKSSSAWKEELDERKAWDSTLADDLEDE